VVHHFAPGPPAFVRFEGLMSSATTAVPAGAAKRWPHGFFHAPDGVRLHYVHAGEGAPVILIHGARGSAVGNWFSNGIAPKIAETNRVYALDMRGHGLSEGAHHGHFHMAGDVLAFMDHMGIEKAHIGGYSMGGGITLQLMGRAPERFITACLQGAGMSEAAEWRDKVPADLEGPDPDEARANAIVRARRAAKGEEVGNDITDKIRAGVTRLMGKGGAKVMRAAEDSASKHLAKLAGVDLKTITFPVMAINGEYDRPNARTHRLARELADFTNLVLPGKGHLTAMMAGFIPRAYIDGYAAFIARNNPKG
jgi:pimeloyl-ACP methyl ester carboxylesterase